MNTISAIELKIEFVLSGESEAVYCQIYLAKNCMPTEYYYILGSLLNISSNRKSSIPFTKSCFTRFLDLTDDDLNDFVLDNGNINTRKKN
jgi:hypothetical protein